MRKRILSLALCILCIFSLTGCSGGSDLKKDKYEYLNEFVTKDVSEYDKVDIKEYNGVIYCYCASPCEWFQIYDNKEDTCYGFIITEDTKIRNNKGKVLKHQQFNVGLNDVVEIKIDCQFGSIYEEFDHIDAWFIVKEVKIVDTIEYDVDIE